MCALPRYIHSPTTRDENEKHEHSRSSSVYENVIHFTISNVHLPSVLNSYTKMELLR